MGIDTARAWVEVDLGALVSNYRQLAAHAGSGVGVMPVVKADAYGLGVARVVEALEPLGPWGYAVASLAEALELRERGVERPVLALFPTPAELDTAAGVAVTPAIGDLDALERWQGLSTREGRPLPFHLEIDTGIGRAGFRFDAVDEWLPRVLELAAEAGEGLVWEGTFTHFHSADEPDVAPSEEQWRRFRSCLERFPQGSGGVVHVAASAAAARWPEYAGDLIRPGLFLYGGHGGVEPIRPRPVATVMARAMAVRDVTAGWTASYGATFRASRPSRWATLAVGYGDGVRRELSNQGMVTFGDREAPIVGRVCMDVTVVDVTELAGVRPGDVATVIGGDPSSATALEAVAGRCGTIPYEILTGLTRRLPRVYRDAGERGQQRRGSDMTEATPVDFSGFVASLATSAMGLLDQVERLLEPVDSKGDDASAEDDGEVGVQDPEERGRQAKGCLQGARQIIDILAMLDEKTRGNLSAEEAELLGSVLTEARMRYVRLAERPLPGAEEGGAGE